MPDTSQSTVARQVRFLVICPMTPLEVLILLDAGGELIYHPFYSELISPSGVQRLSLWRLWLQQPLPVYEAQLLLFCFPIEDFM